MAAALAVSRTLRPTVAAARMLAAPAPRLAYAGSTNAISSVLNGLTTYPATLPWGVPALHSPALPTTPRSWNRLASSQTMLPNRRKGKGKAAAAAAPSATPGQTLPPSPPAAADVQRTAGVPVTPAAAATGPPTARAAATAATAPPPPASAAPAAPSGPKSGASASLLDGSAVARVYYENDQPKLLVDLPNSPSCVFVLKPHRDVNYLLLQLQDEDPSISTPTLLDADGMRVARSTLLADVLRPGLVLVFNGTKHPIVLPTFDERTLPLRRELGALRNEMDKLQELKNVADTAAEKHASRLMWGGFFGLCAQWGLMMRLTWYEYSWDVMEPIAYFISFGTGILGYMFYVVTRKEYTFENLGGITSNRRQRLEYRRRGLDLDKYLRLQNAIESIEQRLETIRREYSSAGSAPRV